MVYHVICDLFCSMYQVLFSTQHIKKTIAIGVSKANPLGELVNCFSSLHSTRVLNQFVGLYFKEISPYTHFSIALYSHFPYKSGSLLHVRLFCLWNNRTWHNGTVSTDYALRHLEITQERSNNWYLIYRHRVYHRIHYSSMYLIYLQLFSFYTCSRRLYINSLRISKNKYYMKTSIRKCRKCLEISSVYFVLTQFHPKKAINVTFLIFYRIIFHYLDAFQLHHLPFILSIHMLVSIN